MSVTGSGTGERNAGALPAAAAVLGCALVTVAVTTLPFLRFAYRAPALHVALETANAVIGLLLAFLVYGRFRLGGRLPDLVLVLALCTVAVANLVLSALPSALVIGREEEFSRWAAVAIRFIGTFLFAAAALLPVHRRTSRRGAATLAIGVAALVIAVGVATTAVGGGLPPTVDPDVEIGDGTRPQLVAHPVVLIVQGVGALLYAVAAFAFSLRAVRRGDELLRWVGAGCVLAATSRVHYLLFPSLYSEFVYTGDLLRLGFYLLMLIGAAREIRSYWELRTRAAVLEDRRRMARDLHDGLAQELTYIRAQSQRLATGPDVEIAHRISAAAGRASEEARRAISALTRPVDEAFPGALQRIADELAHRHGVTIVTELEDDAQVDPAHEEALLRIVSEAVHNAARHGGAERIELRLAARPLSVTVTDDGRGFDPSRPTGGFGLRSMRERVVGVGAELDIDSEPGGGTTVRVRWP